MPKRSFNNIYALAIECLDRKINSHEAFIDSVQKIDVDPSDLDYIDIQLTVKVNSDLLKKSQNVQNPADQN